jgi:hypothetical protein
VEVLKEILESCEINPSVVSLHPSEQADDFELHIRDHVAAASWNRLKGIIQKRGLAAEKHNGFLIVYTPKPNRK